jgi:hypothetical protein
MPSCCQKITLGEMRDMGVHGLELGEHEGNGYTVLVSTSLIWLSSESSLGTEVCELSQPSFWDWRA